MHQIIHPTTFCQVCGDNDNNSEQPPPQTTTFFRYDGEKGYFKRVKISTIISECCNDDDKETLKKEKEYNIVEVNDTNVSFSEGGEGYGAFSTACRSCLEYLIRRNVLKCNRYP